jgi:hypothetical protein
MYARRVPKIRSMALLCFVSQDRVTELQPVPVVISRGIGRNPSESQFLRIDPAAAPTISHTGILGWGIASSCQLCDSHISGCHEQIVGSKLLLLANMYMFPSSDYLYKIILVGDSGVGKSCLLQRYVVC